MTDTIAALINVAPPGVTRPSREEAEKAVRTLLAWAGDDPDRQALKATPARVVEAFQEYFSGYHQDPIAHLQDPSFDEAAGYAMALFAHGQKVCADRGLILVDTKYEFGKTPEGKIVVIDEIHTPDSSRFWYANTYQERFEAGEDPESFDKEYVRRWLASNGYRGDGPVPTIPDDVRVEASRRYIQACDEIRGTVFAPDTTDPLSRIAKNLGLEAP